MDYESAVRVVLAVMAILGAWFIYKKSKEANASYSQSCEVFIREKKGNYTAVTQVESLGIPEKAWFKSRGNHSEVKHLLEWQEKGVRCLVFEFSYLDELVDKWTWPETVICLENPAIRFPWFRAWPNKRKEASWWHKGYEKIQSDLQHPFFKNSIVKSKEIAATKDLLSKDILDLLDGFEKTIVEGLESCLILVPDSTLSPGPELEAVVSRALTLMGIMIKKKQ